MGRFRKPLGFKNPLWVRIPPLPLLLMIKEFLKNLDRLNKLERKIFDNIFEFKIEKSNLILPSQLKKNFLSAQKQQIIIVRNKILNQETHFNVWRSKRKEPRQQNLDNQNYYDPFCDAFNLTPADIFGRLENDSALSAANLAKSSKNHSLIIFKKHSLDEKDINNALLLAQNWFNYFKEKNRLIIWNYGFRSGASIWHPHLQIFALEELPLKIKNFFDNLTKYQKQYQRNYFEDLFLIANKLKLAKKMKNLNIVINLTPFKDDELMFWHQNLGLSLKDLSNLIYRYYQLFENFNLFLFQDQKLFIGFLVNRGESSKINSDVGALEIYGFSVVGSNPFDLIRKLFSQRR